MCARVVCPNCKHRLREDGVLENIARDAPVGVGRHNLRFGEPRRIQLGAQQFDVRNVVRPLVPRAQIVNRQVVHLLRPNHPLGDVVCGLVDARVRVAGAVLESPGVASNPRRKSPRKPIKLDGGVARFRLFHQPPLVPPVVVFIIKRVHVARLRAVRALRVPANLNLEDVQRAKRGVEEDVEQLRPLRLRVGRQQHRRRAAATQAANPVQGTASRLGAGGGVDRVGCRGREA